MRPNLRTTAIALLIYLAVLVPTLVSSGAPPRVELTDASALALGFLVPALWLRGIADFKRRIWILFTWTGLTAFAFDILSSQFIVKRELFMGWQALYPAGILFLLSLLWLHSWAVGHLKSRGVVRGAA